MLQSTHWFTAGLTAASLFVACGSPAKQVSASSPATGECVLVASPSVTKDTVSVTIMDDVQLDHAPVPRNDGERLLYRQLYETLIRLDCNGRPVSSLAKSWSSMDGGRRWEFVLSGNGRFWDGSPVTATDVARSWRAQGYWQTIAIDPDSVMLVSGTEIPIAVFADQRMAILKPAATSYPLGAGPYRITEANERSLIAIAGRTRSGAVIEFRVVPDVDARDAIDLGTDVLSTRDPRVVAYAVSRGGFEVVPLPWAEIHVAVTPYGADAPAPGDSITKLREDLRVALARDAVRAEARASQPPYWWHDLRGCRLSQEGAREPSAAVQPRQGQRVVYNRDDGVARDLAERLVALATSESEAQLLSQLGVRWDLETSIDQERDGVAVAALSAEEFATSFRLGQDLLYIVQMARFEADPCRAAEDWVARAPWFEPPTSPARLLQANLVSKLIPLVDTRSYAIVRDGSVGLGVDWGGTILLLGR